VSESHRGAMSMHAPFAAPDHAGCGSGEPADGSADRISYKVFGMPGIVICRHALAGS